MIHALTEKEFLANIDLFKKLEITKYTEVEGKTYQDLREFLKEQRRKLLLVTHPDKGGIAERFDKIFKAHEYLQKYIKPLELGKPCVKVSVECTEKENLIKKDKQALALKLIKRQNVLARIPMISVMPLAVLTTITIGCYFSWWIIAFNIVTSIAVQSLTNHYTKKYVKQEISTDEFISKMNYIILGNKLLINYPLAAFSVYLLTNNFIDNGLTVGGAILGPLLLLAIIIEVLAPVFAKGCEIYAEKHVKDLLEEDPKDRVQNATDLLNWYDPRKLLMFFIMPLIEKCFASLANELSERNFDEVNTNVHDTNTKQQFKDTLEPVAMCH